MPLKTHSKKLSVTFPQEVMFYSACQSKDFDDIKFYLSRGVDVNFHSSSSLTALHQGCIDEHIELCRLLLEHGADPNQRDEEGWTCLHVAASVNNLDLVKLLVEKGGLVSAVNYDIEFPVELTTYDRLASFLNSRMEGVDREEIKNNEHSVLLKDAKRWAREGYPEDAVDFQTGVTPLHVACAKGYTDVVEILLQLNVDVDAQDTDGWTPLHAAVQNNRVAECTLLINGGADTTIRTRLGESQRDLADEDLVRILDDLIVKNFNSRRGERKQHLLSRYSQKQKTDIKVVDNTNELSRIQSLVNDLEPPLEGDSYFVNASLSPISSIKSKGLRHRLRMLDQFHRLVESDDSLFLPLKSRSKPEGGDISRILSETKRLVGESAQPKGEDECFKLTNSVPYRLRFPERDSQSPLEETCCIRCSRLKLELEQLRVDNELMKAQLTSQAIADFTGGERNEKLSTMVNYLDRICRLEDENRRLTLENTNLKAD